MVSIVRIFGIFYKLQTSRQIFLLYENGKSSGIKQLTRDFSCGSITLKKVKIVANQWHIL